MKARVLKGQAQERKGQGGLPLEILEYLVDYNVASLSDQTLVFSNNPLTQGAHPDLVKAPIGTSAVARWAVSGRKTLPAFVQGPVPKGRPVLKMAGLAMLAIQKGQFD